MGRCWLWGAGPPQTFSASQTLSASVLSRAFLCGVCMFSPCSQGVSSTKNSNRKKNKTQSLSEDGQFTWSPGAYKLPTAPGGSWRKDSPGWEKAENKFTATCVCVCVCRVASIYTRVRARESTCVIYTH